MDGITNSDGTCLDKLQGLVIDRKAWPGVRFQKEVGPLRLNYELFKTKFKCLIIIYI